VASTNAYRRLLAYVRPYRSRVVAATACSLVVAAGTAAYAYVIGPLLKSVLMGEAVTVGPVTLTGTDLLFGLPLLVVSIAALKATAQWGQTGLMQAVGQRVMTDLRRDLYARLLELPPAFYEKRHSGELLSRFTADVAQVEFSVTQALTSYVKDSLQVIALLAECWFVDRRLFLLAFVVLPGAAIPVARFARSVKKVATRTQASLGQLTELCAEQLHNLPAVQAYRAEALGQARFDAEQGRYFAAIRRSLFLRGAFTPTVEVMGIAGVALVVSVGAQAIATEPGLADKLVTFLAAALLMYQPLKALSGTLSQVVHGLGAAHRLFEIQDAPAPSDVGAEAAPLSSALVFEDVRLTYDGTRDALKGLTLRIPAGEKVALVGPSGAGKTTVLSALLGFVQPSSGALRWDDVPMNALKPSSVRRQMAWVPQEPVLFSGSVRQNLLLGKPDADEPELWEALRRAHAEGVVRELPGGLDEPVGERGSRLSGGQRQRLAIARAFLRQPSVLLLDEPTSALDAASEKEVQAGLAELMTGRTTLVIAHRLSTVRDAHRLYVVEDGHVVETGTHAELSARGGRYSTLLRQLAPPAL
jgi:subfamily B ATP-binding cassette protein MsbA